MILTPLRQLYGTAERTRVQQLLCAVALSAAAAMMPAQAGTIDFEGTFGPAVHGSDIQSAGYALGFFSVVPGAVMGEDFVGTFLDGADSQSCDASLRCPVNNPSTYYGALNDSVVSIKSNTDARRFAINSFDASFIGGTANLASYPAMSGLLQIVGVFADGTSVFETYALAGPSAAGFHFSQYTTTAEFRSNAFVEAYLFGFSCDSSVNCTPFDSDRAQFGIDNINLTAIPEPASFLLFGVGMIGLGAVARRRRVSL